MALKTSTIRTTEPAECDHEYQVVGRIKDKNIIVTTWKCMKCGDTYTTTDWD